MAACPRKVDRPLASIGGRTIAQSDFEGHLQRAFPAEEMADLLRDSPRTQRALADYLDQLAVAAKAHRQGIDQEPGFKKALELMEMKLLSHLLTERNRVHIETIAQVSPEEVRRFYDQHQDEYAATPGFTAHHLLVYVRGNPAFPDRGLGEAQALANAQKAQRELLAGVGWDAVTKRYSDDLSNHQRGGLIRDGQFGYFAPEVEQAIRAQPLGKPGRIVRSAFGYHILQVESRVLAPTPEPFDKVEHLIRERLAQSHGSRAHQGFVEPIAREVGLTVTDAGRRDDSLLNEGAVAGSAILAKVAGRKILESDFRWFLKDAVIERQRSFAYSRPGARQSMLAAYLDLLVLEAKARKDGLDKSPEFVRECYLTKQRLLVEFVQARDKAGPFCECQETAEARQESDKRYFARLRAEADLRVLD
jgi:hypothetical protein